MAVKEAKCPACGAPVVFRAGSSLVVVCDFCQFALARADRDLEKIGKVAALADTDSTFARGMTGHLDNVRFTVVGRLQLAHGQGTWDEWYAALDDGRWCWLAEAQGKAYATFAAGQKPMPPHGTVDPGQKLVVPGAGEFVAVERNHAEIASAEGELPVRIRPGAKVHYVDLEGPDGRFGTVDYGENPADDGPEVYLGREASVAELRLDDSAVARRPAARAEALKLTCPKCNAPIDLQAPDQSMRVTCAHCNSLLDATQGNLRYLGALAKIRATPKVPLGKHGRFGEVRYTCIGFMRRECVVEGITYAWDEYLLYDPRVGFRWLLESNGHWSFVEPVKAGNVNEHFLEVEYAGFGFKAFSNVQAKVAYVLGEFYWEVALGEMVEATDFIHPPYVLSKEVSGTEIVWSRGSYLEPEAVWQAFRLEGRASSREGVAPNQPSPTRESAGAIYRWTGLFYAALVLLFVAFQVTARRQVILNQSFDRPPGENPLAPAAPGTPPEAVFFSEPFTLEGSAANVEIELFAGTRNTWLAVNGALIHEDTGRVDLFGIESAYYAGVEDGESWSEGSQADTEYLSHVPAGRYVVRLEPQWERGKPMTPFRVQMTWGAPRLLHPVLAALALALVPLAAFWREKRFEQRRWAESTYGDGSGGEDDE